MNTSSRFVILISLLLVITAPVITGCKSAKAEIDRRAQRIGDLAGETTHELDAALDTGDVGPAAVPHVDQAKANQHVIRDEADKARTALHGVEDTTPWWRRLLANLAIAGALIALVILLWQTGLGYLIKRVCYAIGLFIPRGTKATAALDAEAVVRRRACSEQRESIAAKRATDPAYDAEFIRQKRRAQIESVNGAHAHNDPPKGVITT